jgi:tRNA pseudouridine38-40 synthase
LSAAEKVFRLTVAYDGTDFHGWQRQPGLRTVQGELERALARALEVDQVTLHGAGRTDAGVHARGQVASVSAVTHLPAAAVRARAQRELPADLRLVGAAEAPAGFHARHSARGRHYAYRLLEREDVLYGRFAWHPRRTVDGDALARSVAPLEGEHDFSAFEAAGSSPANPVCRVVEARWTRWEGGWRFDVRADHFLYRMVRNLVGSSLEAQSQADPAGRMAGVLASRDRARGGATVPAHGLCFEAVLYDGEEWTA